MFNNLSPDLIGLAGNLRAGASGLKAESCGGYFNIFFSLLDETVVKSTQS